MLPSTTAAPDLLRLKAITKSYAAGQRAMRVLDNVNLTVGEGEFISIIGPSGSGKTTLIHIMGGLLSPTSGTISISGKNLEKLSDKKRSRYRNQQIGFVFQNYNVLNDYTACENVMLPLLIAGTPLAERRRRAEECLRLVGLEKHIDQYVSHLSGGQRQRVAIARALIHRPTILIADEPTGNLDSKTGESIATLLQKLHELYHVTLILVTHNEQLARRAERLFTLQDGIISEVNRAAA